MRQPDIEIYLRDATLDDLSPWLEQSLGVALHWEKKGKVYKCQVDCIPMTWIPEAVGKWHCLLLESDLTPWENDLSCAHSAFSALGVEVRCMPGSWQEADGEDEADRWLSVGPEGMQEIIWRT